MATGIYKGLLYEENEIKKKVNRRHSVNKHTAYMLIPSQESMRPGLFRVRPHQMSTDCKWVWSSLVRWMKVENSVSIVVAG